MPGVCPAQRGLVLNKDANDRRRDPFRALIRTDEPIHIVKQRVGRQLSDGQATQCVAYPHHPGRGAGSVASDIADNDDGAAVRPQARVVPVAAKPATRQAGHPARRAGT